MTAPTSGPIGNPRGVTGGNTIQQFLRDVAAVLRRIFTGRSRPRPHRDRDPLGAAVATAGMGVGVLGHLVEPPRITDLLVPGELIAYQERSHPFSLWQPALRFASVTIAWILVMWFENGGEFSLTIFVLIVAATVGLIEYFLHLAQWQRGTAAAVAIFALGVGAVGLLFVLGALVVLLILLTFAEARRERIARRLHVSRRRLLLLGVPVFLIAWVGLVLIFTLLPVGGPLSRIASVVWLGALVRFGYRVIDWARFRRLFVTNRRIIEASGILTRRLATMPVGKITDLTKSVGPLGELFNYGTFIVESAGQNQAFSRLDFITDPKHFYDIALLFATKPNDVPKELRGDVLALNGHLPAEQLHVLVYGKAPEPQDYRLTLGYDDPPDPARPAEQLPGNVDLRILKVVDGGGGEDPDESEIGGDPDDE